MHPLDTRAETVLAIGVQAHTTRAHKCEVTQTTAHQVGKYCVRVQQFHRQCVERHKPHLFALGVKVEETTHAWPGQDPFRATIAIDIE